MSSGLPFKDKGRETRDTEAYKANVDNPKLVDRRVCVTNSGTNPVHTTSTPQPLSNMISDRLSVGTTGVEAKVGASPLANRLMLRIWNDTGESLWFSEKAGVTTSGANKGEELPDGMGVTIGLDDNQSVYVVFATVGPHAPMVQEYS